MADEMHFTVKQIARMAGVSGRTLHYYDQIGLLQPERNSENGYRIYNKENLLRLQQILFLRELGLSLDEIGNILNQPGYDLLSALEDHRQELLGRQERLNVLVQTVERTILHLKGELDMKNEEFFAGFSEEQQKQYEEEVRVRHGDGYLKVSQQRWGSYTEEKKRRVLEEGGEIYLALAAAIPHGPESKQAQEGIERWRQHMHYFYDPDNEMLLRLADLYNEDPRFAANINRIHPGLAEFMREAIKIYCNKGE